MDYAELLQKIESRDKEIYTDCDDGKCPVCKGKGLEPVIVDTSNLYGEGSTTICYRKCTACNGGHDQKVMDALIRANISEDRSYKSFNWSIYPGADLSKERKIADNFIANFEDPREKGLYITSKIKGSGKTFLAESIAAELIRRYVANIQIVRSYDLLDLCEKKGNDGTDPLSTLIYCHALVLDDLGQKRTGRDWMSDVLFKVIDSRYRLKKKTIITSNVSLVDLDLDERIIDRLNDMTITIKLPEYCVRAREANKTKENLLRSIELVKSFL